MGSEIVKCDLCGGHYNRRHLASHMRLSHGKKDGFSTAVADEPEAVNLIFTLFKRLSPKARKDVLKRLGAAEETN
jgi:hypothetical protein